MQNLLVSKVLTSLGPHGRDGTELGRGLCYHFKMNKPRLRGFQYRGTRIEGGVRSHPSHPPQGVAGSLEPSREEEGRDPGEDS